MRFTLSGCFKNSKGVPFCSPQHAVDVLLLLTIFCYHLLESRREEGTDGWNDDEPFFFN